MNYVKVKDGDGLVRDMNTKAVLNTNKADYQKYLERKRFIENKNNEFFKQSEDINNMKKDVQELKEMLTAFMNLQKDNKCHQ
jgi:hypothetical protein